MPDEKVQDGKNAAGTTPVQIPDLLEPDDVVRALGHTILPSLDDARRLLERRLAGELM